MTTRSGLFVGRVTHRRLRPRQHALAYQVFNLLLDLDEIDGLARRLRVFSHNRLNLLSFHDRDHGDGSDRPLRDQVTAMAGRAGLDQPLGRIRLLCMPRVMGYAFNPLSVYFCDGPDGRLACLVYEVSNTFGQRHSYVIPVEDRGGDPPDVVRQSCAKRFYVSPFLDMDLTYDFEIRPPGDRVGISVTARDAVGTMIATAFAGERQEMTDSALARAVLAYPLVTLKVVAGIHWEALRIWLKGIEIRRRPPPPPDPVTAVSRSVE